MKLTMITMLLVCLPASPQVEQMDSLERQALDIVRRMPASRFDPVLPRDPFATWFNKVIGPGAGVVWQLTECGERIDQNGQQSEAQRDMNACMEANAVLADGRKVAVAINVGTFKKGISGEPFFYSAVIEDNDQLFEVRRLRHLQQILRSPKIGPIRLPELAADLRPANRHSAPGYPSPANIAAYPFLAMPIEPVAAPAKSSSSPAPPEPPAMPEPPKPQKVREGILRGRALVKATPAFPPNARNLDLFFRTVVVAVVVSEQGRVINAKVIRGHPILQEPSLEAARKWVFEPATLNGQPIKVESMLTFVFSLNQ